MMGGTKAPRPRTVRGILSIPMGVNEVHRYRDFGSKRPYDNAVTVRIRRSDKANGGKRKVVEAWGLCFFNVNY